MKRFGLTLLAIGALLGAQPAWSASYGVLLPEHSRIEFVSKQMGVPVSGQFRRFQGEIVFDPARPADGKARLEVDLASVDAGSREANDEVVGKDWFFVRNFPAAVFAAHRIKPLGGNRFEVTGSLTIKGRSRDIAANATFSEAAGLGVFEAGFILKRLEFGIGEGPWGDPGTVADEVQVKLTLTLRPVAIKRQK